MAELRRLKAWSGLSYRGLERAAAAAGEVLPYSTAATMLRRESLPRETVLVAFVIACGLDADDTRRWAAARRDLAMGAPPSAKPATPAVPAAPAASPSVRRRRPRLRLAVVGVATAVTVLVGAGAAGIGTTTVQDERVEVSTQQP
ncbi:hypothetical protein [Streptomyces sp. NPDC051214]|uniref:hypothetical protein n=1 Tax=Streptomyces sp. NPDC051214 TaxID=3155282 RepID=UPI0034476D6A